MTPERIKEEALRALMSSPESDTPFVDGFTTGASLYAKKIEAVRAFIAKHPDATAYSILNVIDNVTR